MLRRYDRERLARDLAVAMELPDSRQPGPYHNGRWLGRSLRSYRGVAATAAAGAPPFGPYLDTPLLRRTPYFRELMDGLRCRMKGARLLSLEPGGKITAHRNPSLTLGAPMLRLHVPIVTNPDVHVVFEGEPIFMGEGELWYGDFARPHWVENRGSTTRVHLVLDVFVNDYLLSLFPADYLAKVRESGLSIGGSRWQRLKLLANIGNDTFPAQETQ